MAIAFIFCIFLARFFYIQVIWEDELNYLALDQWTREIPVVAGRGQIVDRNGELLAGNAASYSVFARANAVKDADGCAEVLSSALGISYEEVLKKQLRQHIQSGKAASRKKKYIEFSAPEALFDFVEKTHQDYLSGQNTVEGDISHIIPINSQVIKSITHFARQA